MYGGYGRRYGTIGTYGGMGNYGGGQGEYSSMGSFGSFNRLGAIEQAQNNLDPNNPHQQSGNESTGLLYLGKMIVQEFFKMMGGLRSMVEIGFSIVAIRNFGSKSFKLIRKIINFLSQSSQKWHKKLFGTSVLTDKMSLIFDKTLMISPNSKNGNTLLNKALVVLRLFSGLLIIVGVILKGNLKDQIKKEHQEISEKLNEIKLEEEKLEIIERMEAIEIEEYHHQKEAYF